MAYSYDLPLISHVVLLTITVFISYESDFVENRFVHCVSQPERTAIAMVRIDIDFSFNFNMSLLLL